MSNPAFKDEPIPLIFAGHDNKLELNPQALEILAQIPKPLAVVGVAGQYRTGKSYLLNKIILNRNQGFAVGPTVNPCTKGIWMWGKPVKGQTRDGRVINVVILDSEGLGAIDEDTSHDSRIFSLVMLLSSCFIYNSMGAIDEMALESLGLIVDLTKNIQIKSSSGEEEADYEDFAFYMPAFLWVVRDFALELVDPSGKALTPRAYLEHALAEQKGFSDQIEQKNRIRQLLTAFFHDRECFTMVRPAVEEDVLRNIERVDQDALRPEFIEQTVALRKLILSNSKVKTMENVELSGEMLAGLARSYLAAINDRRVPVIENCWTYICRNQCNKAFDDAFELYSREMQEAFEHSWPMANQTLKALHKDCKAQALKDFRRNAVGEYQDELFKQLLEDIKKKYQFIKRENVACFENYFKKFMQDFYQKNIEKNLAAKAYKSFIDFDRDIKSFENYFLESEMNGPNKHLLLSEFLVKKITEAIYLIISHLEASNEELVRGLRQKKNGLEDEIKALKDENDRSKRKFELSMTDLREANDRLQNKIKAMDGTFEQFKKDRAEEEERTSQKFQKAIAGVNASFETVKRENDELKDRIKALERELLLKTSEFEEARELMAQEVKFYEQRLRQVSQSDESRDKEALRLSAEFQAKLKETTDRLERQLEQRDAKARELQEVLTDYEERIDTLKRELEKKGVEAETKDATLAQQLIEANQRLAAAQEKVRTLEESSLTSQVLSLSDQKFLELQAKAASLEEDCKQKDEKLKKLRQQYEKERAVQKQSTEFLESNCTELKRQVEEAKRLYEETLNTLECTADVEKSDFNNQLAEIAEGHKKELKSLEVQLEVTRNELKQEIARLVDENEELERARRDVEDRSRKELTQLKEALESSDRTRLELKKELANLESEKEEVVAALEDKFAVKIKGLEEEIRRLKDSLSGELEGAQVAQEEELRKMKLFYNSEKEKNEARLAEEKEKYDSRMSKLRNEYEEKLRSENLRFEEEIETIQSEVQGMKISHNAFIQSLTAENAKRADQNKVLQEQLSLITEEYESLKKNFDDKVSAISNSFEQEKGDMMALIDRLGKEKAERDNEVVGLAQRLHTTAAELSKVTEFSTIQLGSAEREVTRLKEELDKERKRAEEVNTEAVEQKIDSSRKLALASQQTQFLTHRLDEVSKQLDYSQRKLDERLALQREEFEKEFAAVKDKFAEEKAYLETKYENKRKALKEVERTYADKISAVENQKGVLQEKLNQLKTEFARSETTLTQENKGLQQKLEASTVRLDSVQRDLQVANEELKKDKYKLELDLAELEANYEKDKALWKGKFEFLEEQKDQLKRERDHSQKNFDLMLQKFQKIRNSEKEENLNSQSAIVANVESRFNSQITELNEKHRAALQVVQDRNTKLEREIKALNEKLLTENNAKFDNYHNLERKLTEKAENEKLLQDQIAKVKHDRELKIQQAQKKSEEELERYKATIAGLEDRLKEAEKRRTNAVFEHEKDKAKWIAEMDYFQRNKTEILERNTELERSKERLIKENEKLKNENKKFRLLGNDGTPGMRFRFPGANVSKVNDRSFVFEGDKIMKNYMTKDSSKNFMPDNISDNDSQTNKLLNELNQN